MNFLAPLFLLGALAVALPVVFHLIRRTTRERMVFSSLMFLRPTPPRLTKRNRLEHLLLLLLRCAVICLLALGFARPFFKQPVPPDNSTGPARRVVVLLDASASMRRGNLWAQARDKADAVFRQAKPGDQFALVAFDREFHPLLSFEQWNSTPVGDRAAVARSRLAETAPGWSATSLDQALISAAELLSASDATDSAGTRQIVLISDLQEGSHLNRLQAHEWPKGVEVITERLAPRVTSNAGLQWLADSGDTERSGDAAVRVRVSNASDSKREQLQVGWARGEGGSFVGKPIEIYVPPGQSRVVALPVPPTNSAPDRVVLRGDDEDFDNTVFVLPPVTSRLTVLYFGSDSETDTRQPLFFLRRAFQETRRQAIRVVPQSPSTPATAAALIVATDSLTDAQVRELRERVQQGATLLFAPVSAKAAGSLAGLFGLERFGAEDRQPESYAMLGEIDFRHPLFAPFADPRYGDFTKIHFWKYRRFDSAALTGARVLARFDNGDAAISEAPLGKGRVFVFASGWHPADSQLALSSKFVPLLYSVLDLSGGAPSAPAQYQVGDAVPLPAAPANSASAISIRLPDGKAISLAAGETNFTQTLQPGLYTITSTQPPKTFAVNLDAAESRTAPLPADELERFSVPVPRSTPDLASKPERRVVLHNAELEARQKLWRWLVLATLALLGVETWLAGRTARRLATQGEMTA